MIDYREGEQVYTSIYPTYWAYCSLLIIAFLLISTGSFFLFWLLAHSWWGIGILVVLGLCSVYCLVLAIYRRYCHRLIITDQRIIVLVRTSLFDVEVSEMIYDMFENIVVSQKGIVARIFRFGTVCIGGQYQSIKMEIPNVRHPYQVRDIILKQKDVIAGGPTFISQFHKLVPDERLRELAGVLKFLTPRELKRFKDVVVLYCQRVNKK